jgi:hypothetical protein
MAVGVDVARVAGMEPAFGILRLARRLGVLVVLLEEARRAGFTLSLGWMQTKTLVSVEPYSCLRFTPRER